MSLFTLFAFNAGASESKKVSDLISGTVFWKCCPGPACIADSFEDELFAGHLAEVIKAKGEIKYCFQLERIHAKYKGCITK